MVVLDIPRAYSLVIFTAIANWFVLMWQAMKVAKARKQYNVKYPTLYENKDPSDFNCIQRAHQNSLEWNPAFLSFLLLGGLSGPIVASVAGMIYNAGRVVYAQGYATGNPHTGLWGLYGLFYLIGATIHTAIKILLS